jgi:hypothetical protein
VFEELVETDGQLGKGVADDIADLFLVDVIEPHRIGQFREQSSDPWQAGLSLGASEREEEHSD